MAVDISSGPAVGAFAITTSDGSPLSRTTRAIYVGVSGDITADLVTSGTSILFKSVPIGILPIEAIKVWATGTTASSLIGLY